MQLPFISVILPVRNEERYIAACVDSIFSQDYPADQMEVIFVDGRSEDRTVELLHAMQKEHPQIVVLDNPNRTVPYAMNIGIAHSSAPVIVRLDAHAEYPADYIRLSVETLLTKDCDNAGGVFETHGRGFMGEAIAEMLKTPLGVGNATYRLTTEDGYVDTVPFGCFKRALFDRIGGFDERMTRNQDNELNFRIRKNGGKIYLNHNIRVQYYCRDTMRGIMKMGYMNGKWNVITMTLVPGSMGVRHFVPLAFVLSTILLALLTLLTKSMLFGGLLALEWGICCWISSIPTPSPKRRAGNSCRLKSSSIRRSTSRMASARCAALRRCRNSSGRRRKRKRRVTGGDGAAYLLQPRRFNRLSAVV